MKRILFLLVLVVLFGCAKNTDTCNIVTGECGDKVQEKPAVNASPAVEVKAEGKKEIKVEEKTAEKKYDYRMAVKEGELVRLKVSAEDSDDKQLSYTFSQPLNEKGEWQTKKGDRGDYNVVVTVSDGKNSVQSKVLLVVEEKENLPPRVDVSQFVEVKEGEDAVILVTASDPEGDNIITAVYDSRFVQDGNRFVWKTNFNDSGEYSVRVEVSDGYNLVQKEVKVSVIDNKAPKINAITLS